METCIYEIDFEWRSDCIYPFHELHKHALVKGPKNLLREQLETLCIKYVSGFCHLNDLKEAHIENLIEKKWYVELNFNQKIYGVIVDANDDNNAIDQARSKINDVNHRAVVIQVNIIK